MNNIQDVISAFNLSQPLEGYDLLIDLNNEWTDGNAYQININGTIREIEMSKVNANNHIVFIDTSSKQATVLSLAHNQSSTSYSYQGEVILYTQIGAKTCSLKRFENTNILKFAVHIPATRKKKSSIIEHELPDNPDNLAELEALFYETISLF